MRLNRGNKLCGMAKTDVIQINPRLINAQRLTIKEHVQHQHLPLREFFKARRYPDDSASTGGKYHSCHHCSANTPFLEFHR